MIHVDFNDLNDMMDFAKTLAGMLPEKEAPARAVADSRPPVTPPLPQSPASPAQAAAASARAQPAGMASATQPAAPSPVPTSPTTYALDDLARAAGTLMDTGRQAELVGLLQQFGVASLPELPQAQYGAFATALRGLGAQI